MDIETKNEINRVFQLQKKHQKVMRSTTAEQRKAKLNRFLEVVVAHEEEIIEAVRQDVRKPHHEVKRAEILGTIKSIQDNINNLDEWMAPKEVGSSLNPDAKGYLMYESKGTCLVLGPWNYPFMLTMAPLAAAIAAGNCAIIKLSDFTMKTSNIAAKIIREAFDESEVAIFEGDVDVATELLEQPFDHIFFTGSTNVGKIVMTAAAKHLSSVTLELGGKSPTIIDEGYDLLDAAKKLPSVNSSMQAKLVWRLIIYTSRKTAKRNSLTICKLSYKLDSLWRMERPTGINSRKSSMSGISTGSKPYLMMRSNKAPKSSLAASST